MRLVSTTVVLLSSITASGVAQAQEPAAVEAVRKATVTIQATKPDGSTLGSGFIVGAEGIVATAAHVVTGATSATVRLMSGEEYNVEGVIVIDSQRDFAVLRIPGFELPTVKLGNSDEVEAGHRVFAVGAPQGLEASLSDGLVSALRLLAGTKLLQISVPVSAGSSGGPLTTADGRVVGVVVGRWNSDDAEELNFALPINYLRGHLALAGTKTPTPLSQMTYEARRTTTRPGVNPVTGEKLPHVVNDSLNFDWEALDRVEVYYQIKRDKNFWDLIQVRYSITSNHLGERLFEFYSSRNFGKIKDRWDRVEFFESSAVDEVRTVLNLDQPNTIDLYAARTSYDTAVDEAEYHISIRGTQIAWDSAGTKRSGWVPTGTLPVSLLAASIASLPGTLRGTLHIWAFDETSWPAEVHPVKLEFGAEVETEVRVPKKSDQCGINVKTDKRTISFTEVGLTRQAKKREWSVMTDAPHVGFWLGGGDDVKCVFIPDKPGTND